MIEENSPFNLRLQDIDDTTEDKKTFTFLIDRGYSTEEKKPRGCSEELEGYELTRILSNFPCHR